MEREAKGDAFRLLADLSADAPPNLLFIEAGKARATSDIIDKMRDAITAAFRYEDDGDEH